MMRRLAPSLAPVVAVVLALGTPPVMAHDGPAIPLGSTPQADVLGHVFFALCPPRQPALMGDSFGAAKAAFGWVEAETEADVAAQTPDGAILATLSGTALSATCTLTIPASIGEDGGDLYVDVEAHLAAEVAPLPKAEFTDGGIVWAWDSYRLTFIETVDGFTLTLEAQP